MDLAASNPTVAARPFAAPWAAARSRARLADVAALGLGLAVFAVWSWMLLAEYNAYHDRHRDMAIHANVLWNIGHGRWYDTSLLTRNDNLLAEHLSLVLVPLAAVFRIFPDPRWLTVLQQALLALSGLPIYWYARRCLGSGGPALVVLAGYYLAPVVTEVAWDYWHPEALATFPLALGAVLLFSGRRRLGAAIALSSLLFEAEMALALIGLAATLLLKRQPRPGLVVGGVAAAYLCVAALLVMPAFHLQETLPPGGNRTLHKFSTALGDPTGGPELLLERGPDALRWFLLPTGGLPLLAPQTALSTLPAIAVVLFADDPLYLRSSRDTLALPLLWLAVVEGLVLLRGRWRSLGLGVLVVGTALAFLLDSRLPYGGNNYVKRLTTWTPMSDAMQRAVAAVPAQAAVGGSANAVLHLATRDEVKIYPLKYARVVKPKPRDLDWWIVDVSESPARDYLVQDNDSPLRAKPAFGLWLVDDAVLVLTDELPRPGQPADATFGETLALEGYDVAPVDAGARVRLAWRVLRPPAGDPVRRLDLVASDGAVLASRWGPATSEYLPAARWAKGQRVLEEVTLPLEPAARPALTRLRIGWADRGSGAPLALADGAAELELPTSP